MSSDFLNTGQPMTIREYRAWLDSRDLAPKASSRARRIGDALANDVREKMLERHNQDVQQISEAVDDLKTAIKGLKTKGAAVHDDLIRGRGDLQGGRKRLTKISSDINRARSRLEELKKAEAEAWERVDMDPADAQQALLERFPSLRGALPRIKPEHVTGEEPFSVEQA